VLAVLLTVVETVPSLCQLQPWKFEMFHQDTLPVNNELLQTACCFCFSRKGGTGGGGWDHPLGDLHMVTARLGFEKAMVGTRWATSRPDCMDKLENTTLTL